MAGAGKASLGGFTGSGDVASGVFPAGVSSEGGVSSGCVRGSIGGSSGGKRLGPQEMNNSKQTNKPNVILDKNG